MGMGNHKYHNANTSLRKEQFGSTVVLEASMPSPINARDDKAETRSRSRQYCHMIRFVPIVCIILHLHIHLMHATATSLTHLNSGKDYLNIERPYFDEGSSGNISAVTDETVILKCCVKNKGNRTVSWMRKRDLHILTTNIYTYTGDQRFSVMHTPGSDNWDLKVDYAQVRDSGIYECQVNTEPKINYAVYLDVSSTMDLKEISSEPQFYDGKSARAKILGSTEIHVKRDSTIALACSVNMHVSSVVWYHGASIVDFDSLRGGISLETEKTESGTTSRLMLTRASHRDEGNYTCVPAGAIPASVRVHVLTGEQPAAMQTSDSTRISRAHLSMLTWAMLTIWALWKFSIISQYSVICCAQSQQHAVDQQFKAIHKSIIPVNRIGMKNHKQHHHPQHPKQQRMRQWNDWLIAAWCFR